MKNNYKLLAITLLSTAICVISASTYAKDKVVVIPLGSDVNATQFNDLVNRIEALENNKPFIVASPSRSIVNVTTSRAPVVQLTVTAPVDGQVLLIASATAVETQAGHDVRCAISTSTNPFSNNSSDVIFEASGATTGDVAGEGDAGALARNVTLPISAGDTTTYYFTCAGTESDSQVWGAKMHAVFIAS